MLMVCWLLRRSNIFTVCRVVVPAAFSSCASPEVGRHGQITDISQAVCIATLRPRCGKLSQVITPRIETLETPNFEGFVQQRRGKCMKQLGNTTKGVKMPFLGHLESLVEISMTVDWKLTFRRISVKISCGRNDILSTLDRLMMIRS